MSHGDSPSQQWVLSPDPGEQFKINGYFLGILCETALGRVFRGPQLPPFYDTSAAYGNSANGMAMGWANQFQYTLPSRGVLPVYVVWFK
jgi:hypothetical protein